MTFFCKAIPITLVIKYETQPISCEANFLPAPLVEPEKSPLASDIFIDNSFWKSKAAYAEIENKSLKPIHAVPLNQSNPKNYAHLAYKVFHMFNISRIIDGMSEIFC